MPKTRVHASPRSRLPGSRFKWARMSAPAPHLVFAAAASKIAKDVLEDKPLYVFKPDEFARYGVRYEPERVEVKDDALILKVK